MTRIHDTISRFALAVWLTAAGASWGQSPPRLIDSVPADLELPTLQLGPPAPGRRVRQVLASKTDTSLYHVLYLPSDFDSAVKHPVIVELAGNGGYRNQWGDVSTGLPEGSKLGYGISAGKRYIWVCVPFLNGAGDAIATQWWGDSPDYDVKPTIDYCQRAVDLVCQQYSGDRSRVILAGFSRGAIACNYLGLHDDQVAKLWCGFIAYSHYDGVRRWPYPDSDRETAMKRLRRIGDRPQLICHETSQSGAGLSATRRFIESSGIDGDFTFLETGFVNHNDAWLLRPGRAREAARRWLAQFHVSDD